MFVSLEQQFSTLFILWLADKMLKKKAHLLCAPSFFFFFKAAAVDFTSFNGPINK